MSNVINKSVVTEAAETKEKRRHIIIIALGAAIVAVLVYFAYSHINHPDSYAELEPMMDEAREFQYQASESASAYAPIEEQMNEEAYFTAIEEGYEDSVEKQQEIIDMIAEADEKIRAAGGITNYEELQARKIPVEDEAAAQAIAEHFGDSYPSKKTQTISSDVEVTNTNDQSAAVAAVEEVVSAVN